MTMPLSYEKMKRPASTETRAAREPAGLSGSYVFHTRTATRIPDSGDVLVNGYLVPVDSGDKQDFNREVLRGVTLALRGDAAPGTVMGAFGAAYAPLASPARDPGDDEPAPTVEADVRFRSPRVLRKRSGEWSLLLPDNPGDKENPNFRRVARQKFILVSGAKPLSEEERGLAAELLS